MKLSGIEMSYTWPIAGIAGITQEAWRPFDLHIACNKHMQQTHAVFGELANYDSSLMYNDYYHIHQCIALIYSTK